MTAPPVPASGAEARVAALLRLEGGSSRAAAARDEAGRYAAFRDGHGLPDTADAVALYLTWLLDTGSPQPSGARLRYRLRLLEIDAVTRGRPGPSADRHLRTYVRGLHREAALGPERNRAPLYTEDVRACVDAIDADRLRQTQDVAMMLLANATGLPVDVLRRLRWDQVRLRRRTLTVDVPPRKHARGPTGRIAVDAADEGPCAVRAMADLRRQAGPVPGPVFVRQDGLPPAMATVQEVLAPLRGRGRPWRTGMPTTPHDELGPLVGHLGRPRHSQLRDSALLLVSFAACLTTGEAMALRVGHVRLVPEGLLLDVPGRREGTGVPRGSDDRYCAAGAWAAWLDRLSESGQASSASVAFPRVAKSVVARGPVDASNLSRIVAKRCDAAGLRGDYAFTSLRIGFLRSAAREGVPDHLVLRQAGLRWLHSVELHARRERLVSHSLAGRIGL